MKLLTNTKSYLLIKYISIIITNNCLKIFFLFTFLKILAIIYSYELIDGGIAKW